MAEHISAMTKKQIGKEITRLRKLNGLSKHALCRDYNINRGTLFKMEKGEIGNLDVLMEVIKILGAEIKILEK